MVIRGGIYITGDEERWGLRIFIAVKGPMVQEEGIKHAHTILMPYYNEPVGRGCEITLEAGSCSHFVDFM